LPIEPSLFFGTNSEEVAQGDIFKDVPFVRLELDRNLTLLRKENDDQPVASIDEGELFFVAETEVEAFPEGRPEQCVLPILRLPAMLLTPTCNLSSEDYWLFSPLHSLDSHANVDRKMLHSTTKGYANLFGVYASAVFDEALVNFHDLVSVPSEPFRHYQDSRIATLSKTSQNFLEDKLARFLSRGWGYAPHEKVEKTGFYRCKICTKYYGLADVTVFLNAGDRPPRCENCTAIKITPSWVLLEKHKRSKPLKEVPPPHTLFTKILRKLNLTKS
jgi:hypothetical protein